MTNPVNVFQDFYGSVAGEFVMKDIWTYYKSLFFYTFIFFFLIIFAISIGCFVCCCKRKKDRSCMTHPITFTHVFIFTGARRNVLLIPSEY